MKLAILGTAILAIVGSLVSTVSAVSSESEDDLEFRAYLGSIVTDYLNGRDDAGIYSPRDSTEGMQDSVLARDTQDPYSLPVLPVIFEFSTNNGTVVVIPEYGNVSFFFNPANFSFENVKPQIYQRVYEAMKGPVNESQITIYCMPVKCEEAEYKDFQLGYLNHVYVKVPKRHETGWQEFKSILGAMFPFL